MGDLLALGGLLLPGWALARSLGGRRDALETAVLSLALGRLALAGVTLGATSLGLPAGVRAWALAACLAAGAWLAMRRWQGRGPGLPGLDGRTGAGALVVVAAAVALTWGVVARSPAAQPDGGQVFHGRHATADSLIYLGIAEQLRQHGLPLREPLIGAEPTTTHELFFGSLAGLALAAGGDPVAVAFRLRPLVDTAGLGLTVLALARALGLSSLAGTLAALLSLLGGGLALPLFRAAQGLGLELRMMELWSFGNAFLLPANPAAPGLQTAACALLLLARPAAPGGRDAAAAGALVGLGLGLKAAIWAGLVPALALAALRGDRALRRALAWAAVVSLPLLVWTLWVSLALRTARAPLPLPCPGCLPRYALQAAWGDPWQATAIFDAAGAQALGDPVAWLAALPAAAVWLALTWGARWAAAPRLLRAWRRDAGGPRVCVERVLGAWALVGALLTVGVHTPPHFPNAGQFAWCAGFVLWIPLAGTIAGAWARGRRAVAALLVGLALVSGPAWLWLLGFRAPPVQRLDPPVRALVEAAGAATRPGDLVLEPSLLVDRGFPTPFAWLAGRPVLASQGGMVRYLPPAELARRRGWLEAIYQGTDPEAAAQALRRSGAALVVAPHGASTPLRVGRDVDVVFENQTGRLLRPRWLGSP